MDTKDEQDFINAIDKINDIHKKHTDTLRSDKCCCSDWYPPEFDTLKVVTNHLSKKIRNQNGSQQYKDGFFIIKQDGDARFFHYPTGYVTGQIVLSYGFDLEKHDDTREKMILPSYVDAIKINNLRTEINQSTSSSILETIE